MKTYKNLITEIQRLQALAARRRREEVTAVIADIRQKLIDYDITVEELQGRRLSGRRKKGALKKGGIRKVPPKYRDPKSGQTWSGRGLTPRWLREREKRGAKREEFLIKVSQLTTKARRLSASKPTV